MSKTCLIFSINSFIGSNLSRYIHDNSNYSVIGTARRGGFVHFCPCLYANISSLKDVERIIKTTKPDIIINTAAISNLSDCENNPILANEINCSSIYNILNSIVKIVPKCKFINLGSTYELNSFGSVYAQTKRAARDTIKIYQNKGIWATQLYLSNVCGKDQDAEKFIVPKIIKAAQDIKKGKAKFIELGNLDSEVKLLEISEACELIWSARNYELVDLIIEGNATVKIKDLVKFIFNRLEIENWEKYIKINPELCRPKEQNIEYKSLKIKSKKNLGDIIEKLLE